METVRGIQNARALGVRAREFDDGFDALAAGAGEKRLRDASAGAGAKLFRKMSGEARNVALQHRRTCEIQLLLQRRDPPRSDYRRCCERNIRN